MKAEELRIGDLIYNLDYEIVKVSGMRQPDIDDPYEIEMEDEKGLFSENCIEDISPIPLTEEWLLRMGFEKTLSLTRPKFQKNINVEYFLEINWHKSDLENKVYGITSALGNDDFFSPFWNHIKYVHQLQNLYYALTGKELTTK